MQDRTSHWRTLCVSVVALMVLLLGFDRIELIAPPQIVENRALAARPVLPEVPQELARFRNGTDAYANDQFPTRNYLIGGLNYLRYKAGYSGTPQVIVGDQGWLFYDGSLRSEARLRPLNETAVKAWMQELAIRREYLSARGTQYFAVAAPVKETFYPERVPPQRRLAWQAMSDAAVLQAYASRVHEPGLIDVVVPMAAAQRNGLAIYSPLDTHWTAEGAYAAYAAVIEAMAMQGLKVNLVSRSELFPPAPELPVPQDLAYMLGIAGLVQQQYAMLTSQMARRIKVQYLTEARGWTAERVIDTGSSGPVLQLVGDSFSRAWLPMLYGSFSRIIFSHYQNGFYRSDLTERFHPDVVLLEVIESGVRHGMAAGATTRLSP